MGQGSSCAAPAFSGSLSCPHLTKPGLGHLPWGSATLASAPSQSCPRISQRRASSGSNSWPSCYKSTTFLLSQLSRNGARLAK